MLHTDLISGEGIPDLLLLLVQWAQKTMEEKLTFVNEVQVMYFDLCAITEKNAFLSMIKVMYFDLYTVTENAFLSITFFCFSVLYWKSRSWKVMVLLLMLFWSMVYCTKEIK